MYKKIIPALISGAFLAPAAFAQAPAADAPAAGPHTFTGNVSLTTDYRFRGLSQTSKKPAIQGGFDYSHESGLYAGVWGSSVSGNQYPGASMEMDLYAGYKFEPIKDLGIDVGYISVKYPGSSINANTPFATTVPTVTGVSPDTQEIYVGVTYQWFSAKYNQTVGTSLFGLDYGTVGRACSIGIQWAAGRAGCNNSTSTTKGSGYLDLGANFEIGEKLTLNLHAGHQSVKNYSMYSYSDYKIGVTKELGGYNLSAAVYGTSADDKWWYAQSAAQAAGTAATLSPTGSGAMTDRTKIGDTGLVLSISKTF